MDLSTAERARVLLMGGGIQSGTAFQTDQSTAVAQILTSVSAAVESYLDRYAESGISRTEYFDVAPFQTVFPLRAFPVASVTNVWFDTEQTFATALTATTDYWNPVLDSRGLLRLREPQVCDNETKPAALKVTYTGGMAASAAAFVTAYPDIAAAVDSQVVHEYQRRRDRGVLSYSSEGGSVTVPEVSFLRAVLDVLDRHRRQHA